MRITREWAMPNKDTFSIKPINYLVSKYIETKRDNCQHIFVDPFSGNSCFGHLCKTNDLNPNIKADNHCDALEFLRSFKDNYVDLVLFDPPYSPRQVSESYKEFGKTVNMQTTQSSYWGNLKKEISRIVKKGGFCLTCGWNSGGIGKCNSFELIEILLVAHGGWHNDTIVTVERKI